MTEGAPRAALSLHKEGRIDFDTAVDVCTTIQIQIPSSSTFSRTGRNQRRVLRGVQVPKNEQAFQKTHLATSSAVLFRSPSQSPQSLLWRLLDDEKVLEIRPFDLTKDSEETDEASCLMQLHFPGPIHREAIAIVEGINGTVDAYVLTKGHDLYTVSLRSSFFHDEKASEVNVERWCKTYRPASFTLCSPHRLIAADLSQIIVSLSDGRLMRLTRKRGEDGTQWQERTFNDGQWGSSLRGLVRWQGNNAIRYEGATLDQATALAGAISPDGRHVYTICMNHTLKVWELETGKCVYTGDLLGVHREPRELPELMIDPASARLIQIFNVKGVIEGDDYYVMTFSPHDLGQFKIWAVRDANAGDKGIRDLYTDELLRPVDPEPNPDSKAVWRVSDLTLEVTEKHHHIDFRMLMKSSRRYRIFHLASDLGTFPDSLPGDWHTLWTSIALETMNDQPEPQPLVSEPGDLMDAWLDFLFYPGKYSTNVLETALSIYRASRSYISAPKPKASLHERLSHAITSDVRPDRFQHHLEPQKQYCLALHQEWSILWQDVQDVERQLWDAASLACHGRNMPWLIFAGGCAAIRSCDQVERVAHNAPEDLARSGNLLPLPSIEGSHSQEAARLPDELGVLVGAAAGFRKSFSYSLRFSYEDTLSGELWQEPTISMPDRVQAFYDSCHLDSEVSDDAFDGLNDALVQIGGFSGLEDGQFTAILNTLPSTMASSPSGLAWTRFGSRVFERSTRECIGVHKQLVLDLLLVVVFLSVEVDEEGNSLARIDSSLVYSSLLERIKEYDVMGWLSTHSRPQLQSNTPGADSSLSVTILESLFSRDISPQESKSQSPAEAFTNTIGDVLTYISGRSQDAPFDEAILLVQCDLLAKKNLDLAVGFSRFLPRTVWATYIKGRMYLMQGECEAASTAFKRAAWKLCKFLSAPF